jgi:hypothetical protein
MDAAKNGGRDARVCEWPLQWQSPDRMHAIS